MSVATSEFLSHSYSNLDDDHESGRTGLTGLTTLEVETKQRAAITRPLSQMTINEQVTVIVAVFTIVLSFVTMIIEGSLIAVFSGLLSMVMGVYAHYQQTQLAKLKILSKEETAMEKDIVRLKGDNTKFSYTIDELEGRVEDLIDVEDALNIISESRSGSVNALEKDADLNFEVVCNMKQPAEASVIGTLVSSIFYRQEDGDMDTDTPITEEETTIIIKKLYDIAGLSFDEGRLRDTIVGSSIAESMMDAVQNLLDEDIPTVRRIFQVK